MSQIIANLADDEELTIKRRVDNVIPPYIAIGRSGVSKYNIKGIPLASILKTLSSSANWFFWTLQEHANRKSNRVTLEMLGLNETEKRRTHRAYKELEEKGLVVRDGLTSTFLINPKAVVPMGEGHFENAWNDWLTLCGERGISPE